MFIKLKDVLVNVDKVVSAEIKNMTALEIYMEGPVVHRLQYESPARADADFAKLQAAATVPKNGRYGQ